MLAYRLEKIADNGKGYGFFTASSWSTWPKHTKQGLEKFFTIYSRNCNRIPKPTPEEERIVGYMSSNLIVGCKSLEDLYYVWFDGVDWVVKEAMELYQLSVYEVEDSCVKQGKVQVVFERSKAVFKHTLTYNELMDYVESMMYDYQIPKEIFNMTDYC